MPLVYLLGNIKDSIFDFFYDWYVRFFYAYWRRVFRVLKDLERIFALKVNFYFWFKPLYQDYTFIGYIVGVPFRTFRILIALAAYALFFILALGFLVAWYAFPVLLIYWSLNPSLLKL